LLYITTYNITTLILHCYNFIVLHTHTYIYIIYIYIYIDHLRCICI